MQEAGYTVVGENAFKREKDATSPSGYRDVYVSNYDKDIRKNTYGNLPASAADINVPRTEELTIPKAEETEKLTIPKADKNTSEVNNDNNEKGGLNFFDQTLQSNLSFKDQYGKTVRLNEKNTKAKSTKEKSDRDEWLEDTRNSPAARAGISPEMRWQAQERYREFKKEKRSSKESRRKRLTDRLKKKKNALKIKSQTSY
jgi:hypothetical protein